MELPGDPTSVAVHRGWALVAVNTSPDFDNPSGELLVVDLATRQILRTIPLAGQPDSVAIAPSGRYAAIVIENERDEDENDGLIPQLPSGSLQVLDLAGQPNRWSLRTVDLTGLAATAPDDAEAEFVDINQRNQAVVTLQENNHLAIVDLRTASVIDHFSAGTVSVDRIDTVEEELGPQGNGLIELTGSIQDRRREPDTVKWIDHDTFATANEGDYEDENGEEGGSRGFTLFNIDGTVEYDSGNTFEHEVVRHGHYPEGRSENKGAEPEGLGVGHSRVARCSSWVPNGPTWSASTTSAPAPRSSCRCCPPASARRGIVAIDNRGLLAVANETSEGSIPAMITLYALQAGPSAYPQLESATIRTRPPAPRCRGSRSPAWRVISTTRTRCGPCRDSILGVAYVHQIAVDDATGTGVIVARHAVTGASTNLDLEGIADAPEGGFWLASEGRSGARPNEIIKIGDDFHVELQVELPAAVTGTMTNSGFEGVAVQPTADGTETRYVYAVVQREWDDDPEGTIRIARYEVATGDWTFVRHEKAPSPPRAGGWVGMSELTRLPDGTFAMIERDNQPGNDARIKTIVGVDLAAADFRSYDDPYGLVTVPSILLADLLDGLAAASVWTPDKLEGLGVTADGDVYVVTDNDGLDESLGQTVFLHLDGPLTP